MVGFTLSGHRIGTVAIFATLFVAIQVNGVKGCVFDLESENPASDFDLECNGLNTSWKEVEEESDSNHKKSFALDPEEEGCLKIRNSVILNSTTKVLLKINSENSLDNGFLTVKLLPVEGPCPEEECTWTPKTIPKPSDGKWVTLDHSFPLKRSKECNIQVEVGKRKEKFQFGSVSIPDLGGSKKCSRRDIPSYSKENGPVLAVKYIIQRDANASDLPETTTKAASAQGFIEISKHLMLTSASVLTLNHFLN